MNTTTNTAATRTIAFGFAAIVTLAILFGVDSLAQTQHADAAVIAATQPVALA